MELPAANHSIFTDSRHFLFASSTPSCVEISFSRQLKIEPGLRGEVQSH
jgi:hypothetical protein